MTILNRPHMKARYAAIITRIISALLISLLLLGCAKQTQLMTAQPLQNADSLERIMASVESAQTDPTEPEQLTETREITDDEVGYHRVNVRAYKYSYEPELIEVILGENIMLTVTNIDAGHGFALPEFGINTRIDSQESKTFTFTADKTGTFRYFNPINTGEGWKDMEGQFVVR